MSEEKLSSEMVPTKLREWLLSMGCPPREVPAVDKLSQMCRGDFYMVWRSMMEHVQPKRIIRNKRLQVFCDDFQRFTKKGYDETEYIIPPKEISLWQDHKEVKEKVLEAEFTVMQRRQQHDQAMEKISCKIIQRDMSQRRLRDLQRRAWLLQQVQNNLMVKKKHLQEIKAIAESLGSIDDGCDEQKLNKHEIPSSGASKVCSVNPNINSSVISTTNDTDAEEQLQGNGEAQWRRLAARRQRLAAELALLNQRPAELLPSNDTRKVLAHTEALQCTLNLETLKNRANVKLTRTRLAAAIFELNIGMSAEASEAAVGACERARAAAGLRALGSLHSQLVARERIFAVDYSPAPLINKNIADLDKDIVSLKSKLKQLLETLAITERKTMNMREGLLAMFNLFHEDEPLPKHKFKGMQIDLPRKSIISLQQYYESRKRHGGKLSFDLDNTEHSYDESSENPNLVDELKIYLKKFCLEKNRKLVLESGEKIWISETLEASMDNFLNVMLKEETASMLVCPFVGVSANLRRVISDVQWKKVLESLVSMYRCVEAETVDYDLTSILREEEQTIDKLKKKHHENVLSLQKINKTLDSSDENRRMWKENKWKNYIHPSRTVNNMCFKEWEKLFEEIDFSVTTLRL